MIVADRRRGQRVAVFGLGQTGRSAIASLIAGGAEVVAWDDGAAARAFAEAAGARLAAPAQTDWGAIDALVLSPGVPLTHPEPHEVVRLAKAAGVPVIGDTELFVEAALAGRATARLVGITGTNGKSTTTALIGHLLACAGLQVEVGGNIGSRAVLELSPPVNPVVYVIEFSSYQIDLTPNLKPDVAVFLNISPDHLDRHGGMDGYVAAKCGIFQRQGPGDALVLGQDDAITAGLAERVPAGVRLIRISQRAPQAGGLWGEGTRLMLADGSPGGRMVVDLAGIAALRGAHNMQNAAAAAGALIALGLAPDAFAGGFATFPGMPHRMQEVARAGRVLFVNDSKATNAEAAEKSLTSFSAVHWIAGGLPKEGGIEALVPHFGRIEKAYLIGAAAQAFAETLAREGVAHEIADTLERAVEAASAGALASAAAEPVVLLAPACASFDQFKNFEERGRIFADLVAKRLGAGAGPDGGGSRP